MDLPARFRLLVTYLRNNKLVRTQKELGEMAGYTNESYVSQMATGKTPISENLLKKIEELAPDFNTNWLLFGEGDMLRSDGSVHQTVSGSGNLSIAAGAGSKIISEKNHTSPVPGQPISSAEDALREIERLRRENAELRERVAAVEGSNRSLEKINEGLLDRLSRR